MTQGMDGAHHHTRRQAEMRKYSRNVQWMKVALPIAAVALIAMIFMVGRDRLQDTSAQQLINAAALSAGLKLENPRFADITSDGDPYVVTALSALPDGASPNRIELEQPDAELHLSNGIVLTIESKEGELFRKKERLNLEGDVILRTSDGYRADSQRLKINMKKRVAIVPGHVFATGPRGSIEADRLRIEQVGETRRETVATFKGNVRVVITPKQDE